MARSPLSWIGVLIAVTLGVQAALSPIGTNKPVVAGGTVANLDPPGTFFQGFSPPYPTDNWWIAYGVGTQAAYGFQRVSRNDILTLIGQHRRWSLALRISAVKYLDPGRVCSLRNCGH